MVTVKEELKDALRKERFIKYMIGKSNKLYSWRGIDADGNKSNPVGNILEDIEGLNLKEIYSKFINYKEKESDFAGY